MLELFSFHQWLQFPKHLTITHLHHNTIYLGNSGNGSWNTKHEQKSYLHHRFFLSSLTRLRITGAAGMLNHQSLNLLIHLSVLDLLTGEYLVNVSKKASRKIYLTGNRARSNARTKSATANLSVAWTLNIHEVNETQTIEDNGQRCDMITAHDPLHPMLYLSHDKRTFHENVDLLSSSLMPKWNWSSTCNSQLLIIRPASNLKSSLLTLI